jgi:zinc transport system substrate-binding protein
MNRSIIIFLLTVVFIGCRHNEETDKKFQISVSILPQKYFVERIAGDRFNVNVMIPEAASPATYEPTAKQMMELSQSLLYMKIGYIGFELGWMKKLSDVNPDMKITDMSEGIELIRGHFHGQYEVDENSTGSVDPHIWVSPRSSIIIARNIYETLCELDSGHKEEFKDNYDTLISELHELDHWITDKISSARSNKFLIFHPALSYYARDYDLEQISIEKEGKPPSIAYLSRIIDQAESENIRDVFIQAEFDWKNAESVARELGGKVIRINPLDYNWKKQIIEITEKMTMVLNDTYE